MKKLRIAQVAPLFESVPPKLYGGTERVVSFIVEELVALGHDVTVFASGDSKTSARLVPVCERSLRLDPNCEDPVAYHIMQLQLVQDMMASFDIVHYHTDYLHYPTSTLGNNAHVTTLHGRLDLSFLKTMYGLFPSVPVVSISHSQRKPLPKNNWVGNVYHGLPPDLFTPTAAAGEYLAFLGRVSPEKGIESAIDIAIRANIPLRIAAKIDKADKQYFESRVKHLFDHPLVEYIGEIGERDKAEFLGNALALLFPIEWEEPFGLVMVESMACGTPVVAFPRGSVPEIIEHGVNGIIVSSIEEAVKAVRNVGMVSRRECRRVFEERFTSPTMAKEYLKVYNRLLSGIDDESLTNSLSHEVC